MTLIAPLVLSILFLGCKKEEEITYSQFNGVNDSLSIDVGVEEELDAISIELTSTTGEVIVGTTEVDPGGGPLGTEHEIVVEIDDSYENIVDRVTILLDSPGRGQDEFELEQDSADEGVWKLTLVSTGSEGETREDTLTVQCWDLDGDDDADGATTSDDGDTG